MAVASFTFNLRPARVATAVVSFLATLIQSGVTVHWNTFCVEAGAGSADESINYYPTTYNVQTTTSNPATNSGNYASNYSKWIYYISQESPSTFATLIGTTTNSYAWGTAVQEAIWHGVYHNYGGSTGWQNLDYNNAEPFNTAAQEIWNMAI